MQKITVQHPGEVLKKLIKEMGISEYRLAKLLGIPQQRVNDITRQKRGITASTALRLAKFFNTAPQFWLNLQNEWELARVYQKEKETIEKIKPSDKVLRIKKSLYA